jgi:hypothetical protein
VQADQAPELAAHYYRDNFLVLCDTVESRYGDLLRQPEIELLSTFRRLPFSAQCLYVRLVSRVGPWFRTNKLDYPEISGVAGALQVLGTENMVSSAGQLTLEEVGRLFTRDELKAGFSDALKGLSIGDKPSLLAAIDEASKEPGGILGRLLALHGGEVIAPRGMETVELLQLLFFGNRYQSLTDFVLSDLGIARYFPYTLDSATRLFTSREAIDEFTACAKLADRHRELRDLEDFESLAPLALELMAHVPRFSSTERRWFRQCNSLARDLERRGDLGLAEQLYQSSRRHPARERRARISERRGDLQQAQKLCREVLDYPWCEEEAEAAGRILPRVERKLGGGPVPRLREQFPRIDLSLSPGDVSVEMLAAADFSAKWASVHYVENALMSALFGLAFWEQIFAPVPGVFHNPYQSVPSDMYEASFRERRQELLEQRFQTLEQTDLRGELVAAYRRYVPCQCRWVNWRQVDEDLVSRAADIIPAPHLLAIWRRILFDPAENRKGFPDLLALGERSGDYCLIEVKGPGDALQDSQKRWLRFFIEMGMPATVAWVEWAGD